MANDDMLLITFGLVGDGLESFTITGYDWGNLHDWIKKYDLKYVEGLTEIAVYTIAQNITPKQMEKFIDLCNLEQAKQLIIDYMGGEGQNYISHCREVLQEKTTNLILSGALGTPNEEGTMVMCMGEWITPIVSNEGILT
jgi:hypothetical protein